MEYKKKYSPLKSFGLLIVWSLLINKAGLCQVLNGREMNWTFGDSILLNFSGVSPVVDPSIKTKYFFESSATISDPSGNLVLYSNHDSIFNPVGIAIQDGPNWYSDKSTTQGTLLIPDPANQNLYYLFFISFACPQGPHCLHYSKVNPEANDGNGATINSNLSLNSGPIAEKLSAVKHSNGKDWWILVHFYDTWPVNITKRYVRYLVSSDGIYGPFFQDIGSTFKSPSWPAGDFSLMGEMVFSEQGDRLLTVGVSGLIDLFIFDRCSGLLSDWDSLGTPVLTDPYSDHSYYGASFSPDGSKIYVSEGNDTTGSCELFQFDLNAPNIQASKTLIFTQMGNRVILGQHQIAPDGKIYVASSNLWTGANDPANYHLSVIENPNGLGPACNFNYLGVDLGIRKTYIGLPNMANYDLGPINAQTAEAGDDTIWVCEGNSINLGVADTTNGSCIYSWQMAGGPVFSTSDTLMVSPVVTTTYVLIVTDTALSQCAITTDTVTVYVIPETEFPVANAGKDTILCLGESIVLGDSGMGIWNYLWLNSNMDTLSNNPQIVVSPLGTETYYLTISHPMSELANHCATASDSVLVTVELPVVIPDGEDITACAGEVLVLGLDAEAGVIYQWTPASTLQSPVISRTQIEVWQSETLLLTGTDTTKVSSCRSDTATFNITAENCEVENVITPNGDGINDYFDVGDYYHQPLLVIYDRNGTEVYRKANYQNEWNGASTNSPSGSTSSALPAGVYYYSLFSPEMLKPVTGWVTVLR